MGCRKVGANSIWVTCPCGLDVEHNLDDIDVDGTTIILPQCECGRRNSLFVNSVSEDDESTMPDDVLQRNIANQSAYKKLKNMGKQPLYGNQLSDDVNVSRLAMNGVVEATLHPMIAKAKRDKEAKK